MIKKEVRVLGIASVSPHQRDSASTHVVGVVYRGNRWLEGVMRAVIPREQSNLTTGTAKMVTRSPHLPQLRVIVLDRLITRSGSYIDIKALSKKTRLPTVAVLRREIPTKRLSKNRARNRQVLEALAGLSCRKWKAAGKTYFVYSAGMGGIDLDELLGVCASREGLPEAARVARITASSLQKFLAGHVP
jgi:endonuclease V-like protein UPF0215 family